MNIESIWHQRTIRLNACHRGCHLITPQVLSALPELASIRVGLLHVFLQHTSASITLNENADPTVLTDMELALNHLVPDELPFEHTLEGADDMPAHVKNSLLGSGLTIPVGSGRLCLGTWQGVYLCEHRDHATARSLVLTLFGQSLD